MLRGMIDAKHGIWHLAFRLYMGLTLGTSVSSRKYVCISADLAMSKYQVKKLVTRSFSRDRFSKTHITFEPKNSRPHYQTKGSPYYTMGPTRYQEPQIPKSN